MCTIELIAHAWPLPRNLWPPASAKPLSTSATLNLPRGPADPADGDGAGRAGAGAAAADGARHGAVCRTTKKEKHDALRTEH